ncbi:MAG: NUDIX domain-containing protein [Patescibacteria group bacterium]
MPHIHEKIDFTSEVFIVHKDKVLLRMHDKFKIWLSVGGHIELDEDPEEAAIREVKEEVGLDIELVGRKPDLNDPENYAVMAPQYMVRHFVNATHEHVTFVYFARSQTDKVMDAISGHELAETKWVDKEGLEKMDLKNNIRFFAMKALEELGK